MKVVQKILQSFQIKLLLLLVVALQALCVAPGKDLNLYPVPSDLSSQSACRSYGSSTSSPSDSKAYDLSHCNKGGSECSAFSSCLAGKAQSEENILYSTNQASGLLNALTKLNLASINFINYVGTCLEYGTSKTAGKEAKQVSCTSVTGGITSQITTLPPSWSPNYNPTLAKSNLTGAIRQGILNVLATSQLALLFPKATSGANPTSPLLTAQEIVQLAQATDTSNKSSYTTAANSLGQVKSIFTDILNNPQGAAITLLLQTIPANAGSSGNLINFANTINTTASFTNFTYTAFKVVASNIQYEIANGTNTTAAQLSTYLTSQTVTLPSAAQLTAALSQPVSQTIAQFLAQWGAIKQSDITKKESDIATIISSAKPYTPIFNSATEANPTSYCNATTAQACQNIFVTAFEASNQSPAPIDFSPGILNPNKNLPTTIQQLDEFLQQYACCVILSQKLANDQAYCVANNFETVVSDLQNATLTSSSGSSSNASSFIPKSITNKLDPAIFTQLDFTKASTYTMAPIDPAADGSNTGSQMFFPVVMDWVNCDYYLPAANSGKSLTDWKLCMSGSAAKPPSGIGAQIQLLQNALAPANIALQKYILLVQMMSAYQGKEFDNQQCFSTGGYAWYSYIQSFFGVATSIGFMLAMWLQHRAGVKASKEAQKVSEEQARTAADAADARSAAQTDRIVEALQAKQAQLVSDGVANGSVGDNAAQKAATVC